MNETEKKYITRKNRLVLNTTITNRYHRQSNVVHTEQIPIQCPVKNHLRSDYALDYEIRTGTDT